MLSLGVFSFSVFFVALSGVPCGSETASKLSPYFGTKSRYEEVNRYLLDDPYSPGPALTGFPLPPSSCAPLQLSALLRHGTRFPTAKQAQKLAALHARLVQRSKARPPCPDAQRLARWPLWPRPDVDGKLAPRGRRDMEALARRLASRLPSLLAPARRFAFASSSKPRCLDSALAFREGLRQALFAGDRDAVLTETFEINDKLMRFFDQCEKFVKGVEDNKTAMHELDAFKNGPEMSIVVEKIAKTLCLPVTDLDADLVQVAFFTCSFELTIKRINSPWCSLFSIDDAVVLEYLNDLKQYWKRGYGYDINSRSSCNLFQDIFKRMDQAVMESKSSQPISSPVTIQFGHAETLQPLLSLMGYFKDKEPLKARNYNVQAGRQFRSGRIVPYAANLLFLLYHCDKASSPEEEYKVQILLNEKLLPFPHSGQKVSSYSSLKTHYRDILQNCHFDEVCAVPKK